MNEIEEFIIKNRKELERLKSQAVHHLDQNGFSTDETNQAAAVMVAGAIINGDNNVVVPVPIVNDKELEELSFPLSVAFTMWDLEAKGLAETTDDGRTWRLTEEGNKVVEEIELRR